MLPMISRPDIARALQASGADTLIDVWVVPGARTAGITGLHDGAVRVRVSAPAEGGKANQAVLKLIEELVGARTSLARGAASRRKRVRVAGRTPAVIADALLEHLTGHPKSP
ncbi:MAG: DUF167 domain-containing protein [Acidimicrobiia bacterium]|nr:DUF167 domain-containing protein [Acidimicrobiia bacterium]